jgi:hypothetical protein
MKEKEDNGVSWEGMDLSDRTASPKHCEKSLLIHDVEEIGPRIVPKKREARFSS